MSSERWNKVNELFHASLEKDEEQRNSFLRDSCGTDESLRAEVESLLSAHHRAGDFIKLPIVKKAMEMLADSEEQLAIGQQIGAYRIIKEIGRGGMGAVYLGERADQQYEKHVAIKLVKRGMDTDFFLRQFRNERQILANFDHPNIAHLLDGGSTENNLPYFVMEFVEGQPIDRYSDENRLNISQRLQLFQQVCAAVIYAHRHLVIHRDIKPSNIVVTAEGVPKLLDFGIAKIMQPETEETTLATGGGFRAMTPEYASPEQAQGLSVTTLTDVYSLGVVLYELVTGHSPYQFKSRAPQDIARIITETEPQMPSTVIHSVEERPGSPTTPESVSEPREGTPDRLHRRLKGDLDNVVLMAIRKEPQRRYQSVEQFSEDIRRHLVGLPVLAHKDTFSYRVAKFIQRNKVAVAAAAFAILALVASIVIAGIVQWRANKQALHFQEFGQEVTRIEAIMRYAYLLPLHDVQPEKKQVLERLNHLKKRMEGLGNQAYGPGYYALGRGYLALHRYQDAYDHLLRAWQEYNYRETPVTNAMGLSLALLYQEKLREAHQLYSKDQLIRRKTELEKQYRDSASRFIRQGASGSEASEYVDALLAFMAKQYPEALRKADAASRKIPWLYEGKILEGDILTAIGNDHRGLGKSTTASEFFEKAKSTYLQAASKGQSDRSSFILDVRHRRAKKRTGTGR